MMAFRLAGIGAAALVVALTLGSLAVVAWHAQGPVRLGVADWAAIRFTLSQATVSALISTSLAVPVARALARRRFFGRGALITLLGAPFILPVIVAVIGLLAVFGRDGLFNQVLALLGLHPVSIYGFPGVVLAHVFFNLPLATRLILQGWQQIPAERFRLAAQLGLSGWAVFYHLERPMLRAVLPGLFVTVFLLCLTSFAVALTLGGGPKATTVELAIYQAFRFDFDLGKAALLASVQFGLCAMAAAAAWSLARPAGFGAGLDRRVDRWDSRHFAARLVDGGVIGLTALFLMIPLIMIAAKGAPHLLDLPASVGAAALRSIGVALVSAGLTLAIGLPMSIWVAGLASRKSAGLADSVGYLSVAASPMVIGTGLFLVLFPVLEPARIALPLTALVNALISLPFALRALIPAVRQVNTDYERVALNLGVTGTAYLRLILWPRIRPAAGFAAGLAAALSMGDLGVIALFADPEQATLPLLMVRLMSAYRLAEANGVAVLLLGLSLALFWTFDRGGRLNADA